MADLRTAADGLIIGQRPARCVVIAELGVNHNGLRERALQLVEAAAAAGADAIKLQFFTPEELCSSVYRPEELALLRRLRLTDDDYAAICTAAQRCGLPIFATPFDGPSLALLERLEIPLIKIGSGEVTHTPFLAAAAATGRPIILSTGACGWADIGRAVAVLRQGGCQALSLLHCTSAYPPPDGCVHLRVIPQLIERYPDCTIGFSDHTLGSEAAIAALSLGARIIEKHLTLDCGDQGPDHAASADPAAFAALVRAIRRTEELLGSGEKAIQPCEGIIGRSIVAARDLRAGCIVSIEDLAFKRPGDGLRPHSVEAVVGQRLARDVRRDEQITKRSLSSESAAAGMAGAGAR